MGEETDQFFQSDKNNTGPQGRKMPHGWVYNFRYNELPSSVITV